MSQQHETSRVRAGAMALALTFLALMASGARADEPKPQAAASAAGPEKAVEGKRSAAEPAADGAAATPPGSPAPEPRDDDVYVPPAPDRLLPGGRMGGSTRGPAVCPSELLALVPVDHVGLTAEAQPTLYWFLGEETGCRIDFVLNDPQATRPLVERELRGPHGAGIHALSLADFGVSLEPGRVYTWFVQIVPDPEARSKDTLSGGQVERVAPPSEGSEPSPVARARVLGREGLWYDALAALQQGVVAAPSGLAERGLQSRLLAAQGLGVVLLTQEVDVAAPPPGPRD
jgi:hypothetical protein